MESLLVLLIITCLLLICNDFILANFDPCTNHGALGDSCDKNYDCSGFAIICNLGKCQCHPDYKEKIDTTLNIRFCSKSPDRIDQSCTDVCKLPMFCNNGKCECIRSIIVNDICLPESSLGQSCVKDQECVQPFSTCQGGKCQCVIGTIQVENRCQASRNCPTGAKPSGPCFRNTSSVHVIQNYANSGSKVDNCSQQDGQYCYTDDLSGYGVCCPAVCPLSQAPSSKHTCDSTQVTTVLQLCPEDTHYCHRAAGQSYSSTVCCSKPCLEPTPILIRGSCYARSFLNGQCEIDEQCDGGYGMQCTNKLCQCTSGFKPYIRNISNVENNPPEICVRICKLSEEVEQDGECFKTGLSVGDSCMVNKQCPQGGQCFRGVCRCLCDKGYFTANNNKICATTESRTVKPQVIATGSTPASFIDLIKSIFGSNTLG